MGSRQMGSRQMGSRQMGSLQILSILECHQGNSVKIFSQRVEQQRTFQQPQWFSWDDYHKLNGASDALEEFLHS
jgi:hypothetical protein